ncbi:MAG: universal stress protein [Balneolaceae bacterium]|nr:universal stress protein [Balneolaceae bacterium]
MLLERLQDLAGKEIDASLLAPPVVSVGNPAQAIVEEADGYDAVVMSTHGRTGFSRFFLGSVSEKVLRTCHKPVLIVNRDRQLERVERVMVTTDFSDNARAAFGHASDIARRADAELELVHILTYDAQHEEAPDEKTVSLREQRLEVLAKEEMHEVGDGTHHPGGGLLQLASRGHSRLRTEQPPRPGGHVHRRAHRRRALMMGSTTASVVRHIDCPGPEHQTQGPRIFRDTLKRVRRFLTRMAGASTPPCSPPAARPGPGLCLLRRRRDPRCPTPGDG